MVIIAGTVDGPSSAAANLWPSTFCSPFWPLCVCVYVCVCVCRGKGLRHVAHHGGGDRHKGDTFVSLEKEVEDGIATLFGVWDIFHGVAINFELCEFVKQDQLIRQVIQ